MCMCCACNSATDSNPGAPKRKSKKAPIKDVVVPKGTRVFQLNGEAPLFIGSHIFWAKCVGLSCVCGFVSMLLSSLCCHTCLLFACV